MANIIDEIMKSMPTDAKISESTFEGANIILYTKNKELFLDNDIIRKIVDQIKKRIDLRIDPSLVMDQDETKEFIEKLIPKEAGIAEILFDPTRSRLIIEAEKPGIAIGKSGEILKEIKQKTLWSPVIHRTPAIRSKLIENIRRVLYENNDYRKKFLNQVGKRIYEGWQKEKKEEWVRISFLGGARQVGRSCLFLQTPESKVLLDCGINVAANVDNLAYPYLDAPEFDIKRLDAVVMSHAHLDHMGFIPYLYKYGFKGPVYTTAPSRDVAALLALDYISIAQKENKKMLFSSTEVKDMVKHTICLDYEEVTDITPDLRLTFYNAGHALGSSMVHLHIGNGLHNLVYTADLNYESSNLLNGASTRFPRLETLIIESTYGAKEDIQPSRKESEQYLLDIIRTTIRRGGKVLLPVLGVGRSQEILIIIERAIREGLIDKVPVYIQGMVWDVTAIHTTYPDFFNSKIKKAIFHRDQNPFLNEIFKRVASHKEMMQIVEETGPCIIMATSGMMQGGASVEYFRYLADNNKNSLVLTCYQGEGSLGRRLQNGEREVVFPNASNPEIVKVNIEVHSIHGFSGHSSRENLLAFINNLDPRPKRVIIVHGENSKCLDLASTIHKMQKIETNSPRNLEVIRLK